MSEDRCNRRYGFTLVELLVVIAIIGILVALLLPAVQAARESARRMSCQNKLKNIALGALNYHDARGHFPISMGVPNIDYPGSSEIQNGAGWILNTLPYIEEQSLYDQFEAAKAFDTNFAGNLCFIERPNGGIASTNNGVSGPKLMQTQLQLLMCPSDASALELDNMGANGGVRQPQWSPACPLARTSYKGVLGDTKLGESDGTTFGNDTPVEYQSGRYDSPPPGGWTTQRDCHRDTRCRGIFFRQTFRRPVSIAKVTDGTSKTLMIGEDIPDYNYHSAAFYSNGDFCSCNTPLNYGVGQDPATIAATQYDARGFRSLHPGGVQFASGDGSVHFLTEGMSNLLYRTSCTRNGEESVGEG